MNDDIRALAVAVSVLLPGGAAVAQAPPAGAGSRFSWGIGAGVSVADVLLAPELPPGESKSSRTGLLARAFAQARLSKALSVQLGAHYSQRGFAVSSRSGRLAFDLDCVEFPVTARVTLASGAVRPYLLGGPNVAVRLSAKARTDEGSADLKDLTRSTDLALDVGGGVEYGEGKDARPLLEARSSIALVDVFADGPQRGTVNTRDLKVLAGVRLGL